MKLILKILINAAAIWVTDQILPSFNFNGDWWQLVMVAIVFGLVNAFIRPIVKLLTLPLTIVTLGLFTLIVNALMLLLTTRLTGGLLTIDGSFIQRLFWALLAAVIISVISTMLSWILPD